MVRSILMALLLSLGAAPVASQTADWQRAGGDLFGRPAEQPLDPMASPPAPARLGPLRQPFQEIIASAAHAHGLDPKLLHALVITESGYRPDARSSAGAGGLTQLMPATAVELGVEDRFDPEENLRGGADYLARQIVRFGDLRLALAAYNSGPGRVARLGRVPDIEETRNYVSLVVDCYLALSAGRSVRSASQCRTSGNVP